MPARPGEPGCNCGNCKFWFQGTESPSGDCRIAAPERVQAPDGLGRASSRTAWPVTKQVDWCGKWAGRFGE